MNGYEQIRACLIGDWSPFIKGDEDIFRASVDYLTAHAFLKQRTKPQHNIENYFFLG